MEAMVTLYGSSGKKGRLRSSSWKVKSAKESPHSVSCKELGAILEYPATIACHLSPATVVPQSESVSIKQGLRYGAPNVFLLFRVVICI